MSPRSSPSQVRTKFKNTKMLFTNTLISFRYHVLAAIVFLIYMIITRVSQSSSRSINSTTSFEYSDKCEFGTIYVYDLPSMFNRQLLVDCDATRWECDISTNDGFGRRATELVGLIPDSLSPAWYVTYHFSLEVLYHKRMLNYKCRTTDPESATAFYIPFYAGLAVGKYFFHNHTTKERDFACEMMLTWLSSQPYWKRSNGSDHFIALGRISDDFRRFGDSVESWGSSLLNMQPMRAVTRLIIETNYEDYNDIGVPYPTGFHPHTDMQLLQWQNFVRTRIRTSRVSFVAAPRDEIKIFLMRQCRHESDSCRLVDCSVTKCFNDSVETFGAFLDSDFCLQPRGDSPTRRSVFDCMVAGSIPVFFWNRSYNLYQDLFLPTQETFSVFIDFNDVLEGRTSIWRVLAGYNREKVRMMREKVIETIPKIVYASKGLKSVKDAFDIGVEGVLRRFKKSAK